MERKFLLGLALLAALASGCNKDDEEQPTTGFVAGLVTDAATAEGLEDVRIIVLNSDTNAPVQSLETDAEGIYKAELEPGSYYLRLYKQGYKQVPPRGVSPLPFTVSVGENLDQPVSMNLSDVSEAGFISGKVSSNAEAVAGALVVAEMNETAYSTISDADGMYYLYNLPAGSYDINAWIAEKEGSMQSVSVSSNTESTLDIALDAAASGSVTGVISFLASTAIPVDVSLTHPLTGDPIPGLVTETSDNYTISNVPAGTYLARATYRNDERVVDPDWIVKFGEPYVTVSGAAVERNFSLTNSLSLVAPTNPANTTLPMEITESVPNFQWNAYSSASAYVLEVSDASGNIIWGGIDYSGNLPVQKVVVPASQTSAAFNFDGSATAELEAGKVYRWKVYVSKDDKQSATGWRLISVSEDQRGLIKLATATN